MSKPRYTMIQIQEAAIERLNITRTSEKRHAKWRKAVRKWYLGELSKIWGVSDDCAASLLSWKDVLDMWRLRQAAEEE